MARKREITITLDPALWPEYQRRLAAAVSELGYTKGAGSRAINRWLMEGAAAPAAAPQPRPQASDDDGDDFGIVLPAEDQ